MSLIHELPPVEQLEDLQPQPHVQEVQAVAEVTQLEDARKAHQDEHAPKGAEHGKNSHDSLVDLANDDLKRVYFSEYKKNLTDVISSLELHTPLLEDGMVFHDTDEGPVVVKDGDKPSIIKAEKDWTFDDTNTSGKSNARMIRAAEKAAREAAWTSANERKLFIEANGGPQNILNILHDEKVAAEAAEGEDAKPDFMGTVHDFAKQVALNENRPTDISEAKWNNLTDEEKIMVMENDETEVKSAETTANEPVVDDPNRPADISEEAWNKLSDEEKLLVLQSDSESPQTEPTDATTQAPTTSKAKVGKLRKLRNRAKDASYKAQIRVMNAPVRAREYFADEQKGKRRKILGGVATVAALAAGGYLASKGLRGTGGTGRETVQAAQDVSQAPVETVTLPRGGTVWEVAKQNLGGRPTTGQVTAEAQRILDLNHISWEDARKLTTGTKIKLG